MHEKKAFSVVPKVSPWRPNHVTMCLLRHSGESLQNGQLELRRRNWYFARETHKDTAVSVWYWQILHWQIFSMILMWNRTRPGALLLVPLVEFMYLVFTHMPGESYRRRLRSLLQYLCYIFRMNLMFNNKLIYKKRFKRTNDYLQDVCVEGNVDILFQLHSGFAERPCAWVLFRLCSHRLQSLYWEELQRDWYSVSFWRYIHGALNMTYNVMTASKRFFLFLFVFVF